MITMKVRILRNPGPKLLKSLGIDSSEIAESRNPVDIETDLAKKLIELNLAERVTADAIKGEAKMPEIKGAK